MSDTAATPPSPSPEAAWLRAHWDPEVLGGYDGRWIAVLGSEVVDSDPALQGLLARTARRMPLYAFVTFAPRL